jgi:hypothetical protein
MTDRVCWLCDERLSDDVCRCPQCDEWYRDPAEGPEERRIRLSVDFYPEPPMEFLDKDDLGRGGMR